VPLYHFQQEADLPLWKYSLDAVEFKMFCIFIRSWSNWKEYFTRL